jgi:hypothetical protein
MDKPDRLLLTSAVSYQGLSSEAVFLMICDFDKIKRAFSHMPEWAI